MLKLRLSLNLKPNIHEFIFPKQLKKYYTIWYESKDQMEHG